MPSHAMQNVIDGLREQRQTGDGQAPVAATNSHPPETAKPPQKNKAPVSDEPPAGGFANDPFTKLEVK